MSAVMILEQLTTDEQRRRDELERTIERGIQAALEAWSALAEIRDRRLYRSTHPTFDAYCRDMQGFGDSRARQLILAHEFVTVTGVTVQNERQARALKTALNDYPAAYHQTIVDTAKAYSLMRGLTSLSARDLQAAGAVVMQMTATGTVDLGDGESTPITAALTQEQFETMARQQEHIAEGTAARDSRTVSRFIAPILEVGSGILSFSIGAIQVVHLHAGEQYEVVLRKIVEAKS